MVRKTALILTALLLASPAMARIQFAPFDGPDAVVHGDGGAKESHDGIDIWRAGTPARGFKRIGFVFDERRDRGDALDDSIKSLRLAEIVKEHGGDAAILRGSEYHNGTRQIEYIVIKYEPLP